MVAPKNPRGEVELVLGSTKLWLTPTFGAQRLIERDLECGLMELADRVQRASFGINDVFTIFRHGIDAVEGQEIDDEALGLAIAKSGLKANLKPMMEFLTTAVNGWGEDEDRKKIAAVSNE